MTLVVADRVKETTTTTGTGAVTLSGAATGYQAFSAAIGDGNTTYYCIADQGGANWEVGIGTYASAGNSLARTTILSSSNGGSAVSFSAGVKDVYVTLPASKSPFPPGTAMLFAQTAAPTGWTKSTTHNDKALRVVNGTAGSGGSVSFSSAFTSQAVNGSIGSTTLSTSQIPGHYHEVHMVSFAGDLGMAMAGGGDGSWYGMADAPESSNHYSTPAGSSSSVYALATGGNGSHNHSFSGTAINLAVQYVDVIIATKD
jgi:hypothetical protein